MKDCVDVTAETLPQLYINKVEGEQKGKNLHRLTVIAQRKIIMFVVRLHYAVQLYNSMVKRRDDGPLIFDFKTFPELQVCLEELEADLVRKNEEKDETQKARKTGDVASTIASCHKMVKKFRKLADQTLAEMERMLASASVAAPVIDLTNDANVTLVLKKYFAKK